MKTNRLKVVKLLAFSILLSFLVSCKQQASGDGTTVDYKRTDNTIITRVLTDADNLNSLITTVSTSRQVTDQIFQYLLTLDPTSSDLPLIPQLAKSRAVITDLTDGPYSGGLKLSFEIHETAVWDDGTPITGEDYLFTYKAALLPGVGSASLRSYFEFMKDVRVDPENPKKIDIYFDRKYFLAEEVAGNGFHVFPKHIYDAEGMLDEVPVTDLTDPVNAAQLASSSETIKAFIGSFTSPEFSRETVVGSNAYKFSQWIEGERMVVDRKENWWGDKLVDQYPGLAAYPDQIIFKPIAEDVTAMSALKSEEIDIVWGIPAQDFLDIRNQSIVTDKYTLHTPEIMAYYLLWINNRRSYLSDKNVRKALAHSVNIDTLIQQVFKGFGRRTVSPVIPGTAGYNDELSPIEYNPEKAKQLLANAGWEDTNNDGTVDKEIDGERIELKLDYGYATGRGLSESIGLILKNYAEQVGIGIDLTPKEMTVWVQETKNGNYDIYSGGSGQQTTWAPRQRWHSDGDDRTGFGSARTDELIDKIEITTDQTERNKMYKELQQIMHEEVPAIFLLVPQNRIAVHKRFEPAISQAYPGVFPHLMKQKGI